MAIDATPRESEVEDPPVLALVTPTARSPTRSARWSSHGRSTGAGFWGLGLASAS